MTKRKIRAFSEIDSSKFFKGRSHDIKKEIEGKEKAYILSVDEGEYCRYLNNKYRIEPIKIDYDSELIKEPKVLKEMVHDHRWGGKVERESYEFEIQYRFDGTGDLFRVHPTRFYMISEEIYIDYLGKVVSLKLKLTEKNPKIFKENKAQLKSRAFSNLESANADAEVWNRDLERLTKNIFQTQKERYLKENDFFAAINVKIDNTTESLFSAPTVKKKIIPQPKVSPMKEFASEPMMSREMYDDILKVIYDFGKSMEKKPAIYKGKDEEGLRDHFLLVLETRYESTTATGETFNRGGRTDIILKYSEDNSNLFVAECKVWHGASEFQKAISQLFDRYLSWRDSKTALILFVRNADFSNVLRTIQSETPKHPYYIESTGNRGESSFSYKFRLAQDPDKHVFFEVIAFHFDKN